MRVKTQLLALIVGLLLYPLDVVGQHVLYPSHFKLSEVTLLESPFKQAQDLNYRTLLEYDVDRLLTPYIRQAGLSKTQDVGNRYYNWEFEHPAFESFAWNPQMAMDGHITGRYLSALSMAYASCREPGLKARFKERIDYMLRVMKDCQDAFDGSKNGMKGYIGGIPNNDIWTALSDGDYRVYNQCGNWIPFYCVEKTLSGLRDAFVHTGSTEARDMWRKMLDWSIHVVRLFQEDIMEMQILQWEPGAMNEVLADGYAVFGDNKYLQAARKFSHQIMIENMVSDPTHSFLDLKHCTESTAKFLGFARIDELDRNDRYGKASRAFWEDVVLRRTTCIGGQGMGSYFLPANKGARYVNEGDGPETCNTAAMLRLTERLFSRSRNANYADYYELALINHILSSQDPETGGHTFYTSLRPESYRIYSQVNQAMWCCVGSGMENHSLYGNFIYTRSSDTLFVNLFIPSELKNDKVQIRQEGGFPYSNKTRITILKDGNYQLAVRHPGWTNSKFSVTVNGSVPKSFNAMRFKPGEAGYVGCGRSWKAGDVVEVTFPRAWAFVPCPNYRSYIAFKLGPMIMAAVTSSPNQGDSLFEQLGNEYAKSTRQDYIPSVKMKFKSLAFAPMLICDQDPSTIMSRFKLRDASSLTFDVNCTAQGSMWQNVELRPFFSIAHRRYTLYWNQIPESAWLRSPLYLSELKNFEIEKNTWDHVLLGDDNSEAKHALNTSVSSTKGMLNDQWFRDAQTDQWFEVMLDTRQAASTCVATDSVVFLCQMIITDRGRQATVSLDGKPIKYLTAPQAWPGVGGKNRMFNYPITVPASMVMGKDRVRLRFAAGSDVSSPRIFQIRVLRNDPKLL